MFKVAYQPDNQLLKGILKELIDIWSHCHLTVSLRILTTCFGDNLALDQDFSNWNIGALVTATSVFFGTTLSTANYDALLVGWEGQPHNNNVSFHGGNSTFTLLSAAATAKTVLTGTNLWTIIDGGGI